MHTPLQKTSQYPKFRKQGDDLNQQGKRSRVPLTYQSTSSNSAIQTEFLVEASIVAPFNIPINRHINKPKTASTNDSHINLSVDDGTAFLPTRFKQGWPPKKTFKAIIDSAGTTKPLTNRSSQSERINEADRPGLD